MASRILAIAGLLLLASCSSFGPSTPPSLRALDPLHDDLGNLLIAFDLPRGLGPVVGGSSLTLSVVGAKPVRAMLAAADADAVAGNLPPPANGHAYYLFSIAPTDEPALHAAIAAALAANPAGAGTANLAVAPALCTSGGIDTGKAVISVLAALPGGPHLSPLVDHRVLGDLLGPAVTLPACR